MDTLQIPASYDVWLTGLKHHLDRHPGSKADLARHLARKTNIGFSSAQVKISRILSDERKPDIEVFFEIAAWLQLRMVAMNELNDFNLTTPPGEGSPLAEPTKPVIYVFPGELPSKVAESPP